MNREQYQQLVALVGHDSFETGCYFCKGVQVFYFKTFDGRKVAAYLFEHLVERVKEAVAA